MRPKLVICAAYHSLASVYTAVAEACCKSSPNDDTEVVVLPPHIMAVRSSHTHELSILLKVADEWPNAATIAKAETEEPLKKTRRERSHPNEPFYAKFRRKRNRHW